jgi:hypothetical protein
VTAWVARPRRPDEPACWSWDVPPLRDPEEEIAAIMAAQVGLPIDHTMSEDTVRMMFEVGPEYTRWSEFHTGVRPSDERAWAAYGRCAVCGISGARTHLVDDHCHATGQLRGRLCRSCNVQEGRSGHIVFQRYRRVHPASILGFYEPYDGVGWTDGWSWMEHGAAARELGPRPATPWPAWDTR